jgi:hypothetical protein
MNTIHLGRFWRTLSVAAIVLLVSAAAAQARTTRAASSSADSSIPTFEAVAFETTPGAPSYVDLDLTVSAPDNA